WQVHRHGESTPIRYEQFELTKKLQELIKPWGYGQLTSAGKRTGYKLGKFIRRRYNELLSPKYKESEIYIRSTDSTRSKMTMLTAMSAVYPSLKNAWSKDICWEPVPYTTEPARYDFNTAFVNCPDLVLFHEYTENQTSHRMSQYSNILANISDALNFNLTAFPLFAYKLYDFVVSQQHLGYDIGQRLTELMLPFEFAASEAMDIMHGDDNFIDLQAGVLLKEFFTHAKGIINCTGTQRVRIYSAHDINVYSLQSVSLVNPRQGFPKYGSVFSLELRRIPETGEFVVLPVYLPSPNETEYYLHVHGCGLPCKFDKFFEITSRYLHDVDSWRAKCGFTEDYKVDASILD
ncbi:prostatic acid phosphatase-like, partial [Hyposmocoma kahamanoa]|uniref:prostatic acid phosphatase-like n=1 Tax=Hyposmocoma kahamanoa TaxID=1477025 RepID=UPI000E6DA1FD